MVKLLVIEHADGRSYAVAPADLKRQAEAFKGFRILGYEDNAEEYDGPKTVAAFAAPDDDKPTPRKAPASQGEGS